MPTPLVVGVEVREGGIDWNGGREEVNEISFGRTQGRVTQAKVGVSDFNSKFGLTQTYRNRLGLRLG